ncbi:MAG: toprim domain-containing protein [Comamonadaceae bacterium]|uniref:toprim domain-containing protein n=1 Tax=Candidatus Skiveiella danica TaxID=3386177 RepID=UPI003908C446|nr:toprim domain-containing protein [Comamonadaceae bacterium]
MLAVAEGLETALAVMEGTKMPVWCAVNAYLLEHFYPPPGVSQILVFADKDRPRRNIQGGMVRNQPDGWSKGSGSGVSRPVPLFLRARFLPVRGHWTGSISSIVMARQVFLPCNPLNMPCVALREGGDAMDRNADVSPVDIETLPGRIGLEIPRNRRAS